MRTKSFKDLIVWQNLNKSQIAEELLKEVGSMLYRMLHRIRKKLYAKRQMYGKGFSK